MKWMLVIAAGFSATDTTNIAIEEYESKEQCEAAIEDKDTEITPELAASGIVIRDWFCISEKEIKDREARLQKACDAWWETYDAQWLNIALCSCA